MVSVLIVCLGNICRSPMGEAVLRQVAIERGVDITVDSAGTAAYHVGDPPDDRTVAVCKKYGVPISHEGRQVLREDFSKFDYILAADNSNLQNLERIKPRDSKTVVKLWGSYLDGEPIADPYYGGIRGFETCYQQCRSLSSAFLDNITGSGEAT